MSKRYRGSCLCGMVVFVLDRFLGPADHCHCSMCRKFHGAAYATFVSVERQAFHWVSGRDLVSDYAAPNGAVRSFCSRCGSSLFFVGRDAAPDVFEVALAAFEADVPVTPDAHIFVGSAAPWASLGDDLPRYVEERGGPRVDSE